MKDIISLYRNYSKFDVSTDDDLRSYLSPSILLNQYQKHYYENQLIGFTNWALLSNDAHNKFKETGIINNEDWNSGNNLWHIETVSIANLKNIMQWTKSFLAKKFGIGKQINWLRIKNDKIIRVVKRTTKKGWL
jgi:hemolysin-activating ACP:hemolysin acyltransferase